MQINNDDHDFLFCKHASCTSVSQEYLESVSHELWNNHGQEFSICS